MDLSIVYELRANNIPEEDIELIMDRVKNRLSEENIDKELARLGYPKVFTVDYDDYDDYPYDDDMDYNSNKRGTYEEEIY